MSVAIARDDPSILKPNPEIIATPKIERLLIVRLSAMGDVIHTLPAAQALRAAFPQAHIGWLIEQRWAGLLCSPSFPQCGPRAPQRPLADEIHVVNLKEWGKAAFSIATHQRIARVWNDVHEAGYDVVVDLQGAVRSALLARLSGARIVYGSAEPRESAAALWYTRKVVPRGKHVIEQNFSVAQALIPWSKKIPQIELPFDAASEALIEQRLASTGIRRFAILNPGAGWGAKRWPAERYGEVARKLAGLGLRSIVNCGPGEEELAREVETSSHATAKAMTCTISELIALTRRAELFIGGDTGPLHLAAGLRVPVVGIYGPTDPARNGPFAASSIVLRSPESRTTYSRNIVPDKGMLEVGSDEVVAAAEKLLSGASN